jgi:hypothetical protein
MFLMVALLFLCAPLCAPLCPFATELTNYVTISIVLVDKNLA